MLRPAVVALIASAGVSILVTAFWPEGMILIQKTQIDMVIIFIAAVYLIQFRKMNPVLVMVLSGVAKLGIYLVGTIPFVIMYSLEICNYSELCKIAFCECLHSDRIAILYGEVTT